MWEPVKAMCSVHVAHGEGLAVALQFRGNTCGSSVLGRRTVPGGPVLEHTGFPFTWRVRRYAAGPWGRRACPWAMDDVSDTGVFPANTNTRFSPQQLFSQVLFGAKWQRPPRMGVQHATHPTAQDEPRV